MHRRGLVSGWALTLWVGWSLASIGAGDAVVNSSSGAPVGIGGLFFAGSGCRFATTTSPPSATTPWTMDRAPADV